MSLTNLISHAKSQSKREPILSANTPATPENTNKTSTLPIEQITDRPGGDTRPLTQTHIESLAESIAAVGLIQPIAIDIKGRLLAGGHRLAAITHLKNTNPEDFTTQFPTGIPIRQYDFDAEAEPERALAIEATENEKRRDYTPAEVRELADRLRAAGYRDTRGKPKKGEKALRPALEVIIGKSGRTVQRYLQNTEAQPTNPNPSEQNTTDDVFSKSLEQAIKALRKCQTAKPQSPKARKLLKTLPELITQLEDAIGK
jgi:ParB family transcriptional regulator, chromosome partitioning protein